MRFCRLVANLKTFGGVERSAFGLGGVGLVRSLRFWSSRNSGESSPLASNFRSLTDFYTFELNRKRYESLKSAFVSRFMARCRAKELNVAAPPLIYEGPRNVRYWIRRRRSGARK